MGIYKPLNYDATMLIRLTTEMKDAFFAGCKARGVVPSEEARRLIVAQVLEQWELTQTDEVENHLCDHHNDHQRERKRKDASFITLYNRQVNACLFFCLPLYYQVIQMPKKAILPW